MSALRDDAPPYRTVVFDCDSTLSQLEGIDELAARLLTPEATAELAALTDRAMAGELALEDVYARRVDAIAPGTEHLVWLGERYVDTLLPGASELCTALRAAGVGLRIVSGGLRPGVLAVGRALGIPDDHVHAVDLSFRPDGRYRDFERDSPLARSGGKLELLRSLGGAAALGPIALIGDGMTDLECAPELARFIAFGGVVERPAVFAAARCRATSPNLLDLLPQLLAP